MSEPATFDEFLEQLCQREPRLHMDGWDQLCHGIYVNLLHEFLAAREKGQLEQERGSGWYGLKQECLIQELRTATAGYLPETSPHLTVHSSFGSLSYDRPHCLSRYPYRYQVMVHTIYILWSNETARDESRKEEFTHELKKRFEGTYAGEILDIMIDHHEELVRCKKERKMRQQEEVRQRKLMKQQKHADRIKANA